MSKIEELCATIQKMAGRQEQQQKAIEGMARGRIQREEAVVKALLDGGGARGIGFDGALQTTMGSLYGARNKAIGMGEFLVNVAHASAPSMFGIQDTGRVSKALEAMGSKPVQKTALAEGSGVTGGYTVPPQYLNELLRLAAEDSPFRAKCRSIPMTGREAYIPALDHTTVQSAGTSPFFGGLNWTWQPEAANYQTNAETEPKFRQVQLVARDLVGICIASNQLLADSALTLDSILTGLIRDSIAWAYDYYILRGNGVNQPLGILNSPALIAVTKQSAGHFGLLDSANMLSQLLFSSWSSACWAIHPSVIPEIATMTNGATNSPFLVYANPAPTTPGGPASNALPMTLWGLPVFITEKLPKLASGVTGSVILMDLGAYLLGDRMAVQIEASPYPNFVKNQMTWRVVTRWDGQPWLNSYITLADGAYQVSPFVTLAA